MLDPDLPITTHQSTQINQISPADKFIILFENAPEGIVLLDSTGSIVDSNHNFAHGLGFEKQELIGHSFWDLVAEEEREEVKSVLEGKDDVTHVTEALIQGRWGNQLMMELSVSGPSDFRLVFAREITLRKRMEARIQQLSAILNAAADAICIMDNDGLILLVNPAFENTTGYKAEALLGRNYKLLQLELGWDVFGQEIEEFFRTKQIVRKQTNLKKQGGGSWDADIIVCPICDTSGEVSFCLSIFRNITEQRKLQIALEESERRYRTFIEMANEGIFVEDFNGTIRFVNPNGCRLLGYEKNELIGRNVREILLPGAERNLKDFFENLRKKRQIVYETKNKRKDGNLIDVEVSASIITLEGDESILVTARDITERKQIDRQLQQYFATLEQRVTERTEQLSKLHEIGQLLHSVIELNEVLRLILIAVTAGEGFRFNRAFLFLIDSEQDKLEGKLAVGPSSPEEAGKIWSDINNMPHYSNLSDTLRSYMKSSQDIDLEVNRLVATLSTPMDNENNVMVKSLNSGKSILVNKGRCDVDFERSFMKRLGTEIFAVIPILWRTEPIGVLVVDNAITQRAISESDIRNLEIFASQAGLAIANARYLRELQNSLKESQRLFQELNESHLQLTEMKKHAALGRMAATVAHELKTPLVGIGGLARLLLNKIEKSDPQYENLRIIAEETLRLEYVVERILYFARPKDPILQKQDLRPCIKKSIEVLKTRFYENNIEVQVDIPNEMPMVLIDELQIRQVLINLIGNAIDAMSDGGKMEITAFVTDGLACITVKDTGCGISSEIMDKVFDPFFTNKPKGTGLGLYITKTIMEKHRGWVELSSIKGSGTTVKLCLPVLRDEDSSD